MVEPSLIKWLPEKWEVSIPPFPQELEAAYLRFSLHFISITASIRYGEVAWYHEDPNTLNQIVLKPNYQKVRWLINLSVINVREMATFPFSYKEGQLRLGDLPNSYTFLHLVSKSSMRSWSWHCLANLLQSFTYSTSMSKHPGKQKKSANYHFILSIHSCYCLPMSSELTLSPSLQP